MERTDPSIYLPSPSKTSRESPGPTGARHDQIQVLWVATKNLWQVRGYISSPTNLMSAATGLNDECIRRGTHQNLSPLSSYWIALTKKVWHLSRPWNIIRRMSRPWDSKKSRNIVWSMSGPWDSQNLETLSGDCHCVGTTVPTVSWSTVTMLRWCCTVRTPVWL